MTISSEAYGPDIARATIFIVVLLTIAVFCFYKAATTPPTPPTPQEVTKKKDSVDHGDKLLIQKLTKIRTWPK